MDIKNTETKLDQADSVLTKLKTILKKHWGILLLLCVGYCVYMFVVAVNEEMQNETIEPDVEEPWLVDEWQELDIYGDTITVQYWSDGFETVAE